jgi:hypothetical protein
VDYEIGSIADYISMLALTQLNSLDTCQQLPSIVNMLAPGCDRKSNALTDSDTAYLRGLYKMSPPGRCAPSRTKLPIRWSSIRRVTDAHPKQI